MAILLSTICANAEHGRGADHRGKTDGARAKTEAKGTKSDSYEEEAVGVWIAAERLQGKQGHHGEKVWIQKGKHLQRHNDGRMEEIKHPKAFYKEKGTDNMVYADPADLPNAAPSANK